ncbi:MAG: ABC transporter permease subunit [Anaerolineales bacterium]|jgi:putative spermidine/putrescine transport system permease protein|uniref:ABC transporter permease n=1 Tax=Candidatus Villigracilis vicinus TaxID=3140679 RepID=UPI00313553F9|nr:ABC transporter permease subunit [Anaerolineales bacterium]MBK9779142.1 ABC transporter permease subunit [Anaerolineales bacterium]
MNILSKIRQIPFWSWFWFILGALYFLLPLYATVNFSLRMERDVIGFKAYIRAFEDPEFLETFLYSNMLALLTIVASIILIVPTAYWIRLRLPEARRIVEFITLLPFVVPAIILVFGLIRIYSSPIKIPFTEIKLFQPLTTFEVGTDILIIAGYVVLGLPYMYRSVDTGMRTVDVRTLTEAAQSLGASWFTIILRVILPNIRAALLSGALLTFAIVVGEVTLASFLGVPAFGPYLFLLGQHRAYEPAALSFASFLMTWLAMGLIQMFTGGQGQTAGTH